MDPRRVIGRSPDSLSPAERTALVGYWVALEVYTPKDLPLRRIEAAASSAEECASQLRERGLDPLRFEYVMLTAPW